MKFSQYNLYLEKDKNKFIIANTRNSRCVVLKSDSDIKHLKELRENQSKMTLEDKMVEQLYSRAFIVPDDFDEFEEAKEDINQYLKAQSKLLNLIIYTTDNCNFRCIYCPEKHGPKHLSDSNWDSLYKYIVKNIQNGTYTHVQVSFFGGEPLLEAKRILNFSGKVLEFLKDYPEIYYSSTITTNGYLLIPELYDKLTAAGVKHYMITVDGFKETHEKMRPTANGSPSWDKIMENLKYIHSQNDDVTVNLRANFNKINEHTLYEYEEFLKSTFTNPKFKLQFHPIVNFTNNVKNEYLADASGEGWNKFFSVNGKHNDEKSVEFKKTPFEKFNSVCDAAFGGTIVVSTDGRISKCHNIMSRDEAEDTLIGKLNDNGNIDYDIDLDLWLNNPEREMCKKCPVYPICGARKCPARTYSEKDKEDKDITFCNMHGILYVLENYLIQNY